MKRFLVVLSLALTAFFHVACSSKGSPSSPSPVNHDYPFYETIGSGGTGNGQFSGPTAMAVLRGAVFVVDYSGNKIDKFDLNGNFLAAYTGFTNPYAIAAGSNGVLYVTNTGAANMIQPMDQNGNLGTAWGTSGTAVGQFSTTTRGIAVDGSNNVYVADRGDNRIERCSNTGTGCVTLGGTAPGTGNGQFTEPYGVSIDKNGNLWVADSGNSRIQEFNSSLGFVQVFGTAGSANGQFSGLTDVRMDQDGNLIVADLDNSRVQKVSSAGSFIQLIGTGWLLPYSTAFDSNNNLYVADFSLQAVKVFTPN
jgi:tripartite motif-containing protein 71